MNHGETKMVILEYVFYFVVLGWKSITETADYLIQGCIGIVVGICVLASPAATPFVVVTGVFAYGVGMLAFSYTKKLALNSDPDPIMYYIICGFATGYLWGYIFYWVASLATTVPS